MISGRTPFATGAQQIAAELGWLELLVKREIASIRRNRSNRETFDEFSGLYVSDADIDAFLAESDEPTGALDLDPETIRSDREIRAARGELDRMAAASLAAGADLRLSRLTRVFGLDPSEATILVACLAPDVDLKFQKYFAYLQNDVSKRRPTVQLLDRLVSGGKASPLGARVVFGPAGRLREHQLLVLPQQRQDGCFPLVQPVVPDNVADFLAGIDGVDAALRGVAELTPAHPLSYRAAYYARHRRILESWIDQPVEDPRHAVVLLGPDGSGKAELIAAFAEAAGRMVLTVDCSRLMMRPEELAGQLRPLGRDARMLHAVVHVRNLAELAGEDEARRLRAVLLGEALAAGSLDHLFLSSTDRVPEVEARLGRPIRNDRLPMPDIDERTELWSEVLPQETCLSEPGLAADLATRFVFSPAKVRATASRARTDGFDNGDRHNGTAFFRACRLESNQNLLRFGTKIVPCYTWSDVVLPEDTRVQLREICACVRHKRRVVESWGYGAKFSLGKGLVVLFAGASGTGKTMCAEIMGGDLELDVYKIDLSCVVSKYVGETERNLSRIFDEAETSNSILFFDEADALFGKRSEVKDAHDRYANIEINYLLQKLDDYEGIVILATNLRGNLDKAFTRRLHHLVEFPFPDEDHRERIWARVFPAETPLHDDVRIDFLARRFKLAGGNIKNIAVNSAYLAADNGGRVGMEQVILATKREYQKLGRLCSKSEFGPYFGLVQETSS
jgi:AAA+ superfamily predicted ATPase